MVYVRLQPYRQSTPKKSGEKKLKPRFYGPFRVTRREGEVAYELKLPEGSKVHNVFHESCLKKVLGHNVTPSTMLPPLDGHNVTPSTVLPPLDEEGKLVLVPKAIIDFRERTIKRRVITEYLVKWQDLPVEDTTWERADFTASCIVIA